MYKLPHLHSLEILIIIMMIESFVLKYCMKLCGIALKYGSF